MNVASFSLFYRLCYTFNEIAIDSFHGEPRQVLYECLLCRADEIVIAVMST